jgi:hypothetical protein
MHVAVPIADLYVEFPVANFYVVKLHVVKLHEIPFYVFPHFLMSGNAHA